MTNKYESVAAVALPPRSGIVNIYESLHLADAFSIRLPTSASSNPALLARFLVSNQPAWVGWLTKLRDLLVTGFGLKTAKHLATLATDGKADRIGIFKVYSTNEAELVLGEDDQHLDFRVSFLCLPGAAPESHRELVVSTVVHCHNRLGRAYLFVIAPFHRQVVRASLLRAARLGWPSAAT